MSRGAALAGSWPPPACIEWQHHTLCTRRLKPIGQVQQEMHALLDGPEEWMRQCCGCARPARHDGRLIRVRTDRCLGSQDSSDVMKSKSISSVWTSDAMLLSWMFCWAITGERAQNAKTAHLAPDEEQCAGWVDGERRRVERMHAVDDVMRHEPAREHVHRPGLRPVSCVERCMWHAPSGWTRRIALPARSSREYRGPGR